MLELKTLKRSKEAIDCKEAKATQVTFNTDFACFVDADCCSSSAVDSFLALPD